MSELLSLDENDNLDVKITRIQHTNQGLRWRAHEIWNQLPDHLRSNQSYPSFKRQTKKWIIEQRSLHMNLDLSQESQQQQQQQDMDHG